MLLIASAGINGTVTESFSIRKQQFVDRHGWQLSVEDDQLEIDEYDDGSSDYVSVKDAEGLALTCRIRPVCFGTMLEKHFWELSAQARAAGFDTTGKYELTRFCKAPSTGRRRCLEALSLVRDHLRARQIAEAHRGYFAVVYDSVARLMRLNGLDIDIVVVTEIDGRPAYLVDIDLSKAQGPQAQAPRPNSASKQANLSLMAAA